MILSIDEAICLILGLSQNREISSPTKLNKLLARLNLFFIPVDVEFSLNKFGSFCADLSDLKENEFYAIESYEYMGREVNKFLLKPKGEALFNDTLNKKISKILTKKDFECLKQTIRNLSGLSAREISDNEHKRLLVDIDDRFKLQQKVNETSVELADLYHKINEMPEETIAEIRLKALIEYCYHLAHYLKEKRFKHLPEEEYDFDAYMFDYYFLNNLSEIIPFLKRQISAEIKDKININKYYQYFINSVREKYPFSIDNKDLKRLIVA